MDASLTLQQTSQRLPPHLKKPAILSLRYNFALTKELESFSVQQNDIIGLGADIFLTPLSIYNKLRFLLIIVIIDFRKGYYLK